MIMIFSELQLGKAAPFIKSIFVFEKGGETCLDLDLDMRSELKVYQSS